VLSTYGKSDEFPEMCETLASRLENEKANFFASTLCCMCAASVTRVVAFWTAELEAANKAKGGMDTQALQRYVEKVVVFTHANPGTPVGDDQAKNFATYAALLAAQGRVAEAPRYLKDTKEPDQVLINRLYHGGSKPAGASVPVFPFTKVEVKYCETAISEAEKRKKEAEAKAAAEKKAKEEEAARLLLERQREEAAAAAATAAAAAPTLPPGWSQNVDPRSGKTYYISPNNTSQWDPPPLPMAPVPAPAPSPAVSVNSMQPVGGSFAQPGYGGALGVGAGASMTALASQGGGVGTSTAAPTTATATSTAGNGAPAVVTVNNEAVTGLRAIIEGLQAVATPAEKRQLSMIMGCQNSLEEQVAAGAVANDTLASVAAIVSHINNKDFAMATSMQGDMAKNPPIWSAHSSWLKGLKMLIPIAKKK
jgi:protein transport protein SEC31